MASPDLGPSSAAPSLGPDCVPIPLFISCARPFAINQVLQPGIKDKLGRQVLFLIFARDHEHAFDDNFYGTIYVMERILQDQPAHQDFILITDCAGFGYNHIPPFATLRDWADIMGKHFPKRLSNIIMINVSFIIQIAYDVASALMSPHTREKFRFLGTSKDEMRRALEEYIDVSVLPREYGGDGAMPTMDVEAYVGSDRYLRHYLGEDMEGSDSHVAHTTSTAGGGGGHKPGLRNRKARGGGAADFVNDACTSAAPAAPAAAQVGERGGADSPAFGPTYAAALRLDPLLQSAPTGAPHAPLARRPRVPALYGPVAVPATAVAAKAAAGHLADLSSQGSDPRGGGPAASVNSSSSSSSGNTGFHVIDLRTQLAASASASGATAVHSGAPVATRPLPTVSAPHGGVGVGVGSDVDDDRWDPAAAEEEDVDEGGTETELDTVADDGVAAASEHAHVRPALYS